MTTEIRSIQALYEADYAAWAESMAQLMQEQKFDQVDWKTSLRKLPAWVGLKSRRWKATWSFYWCIC